MSKRTRRMLFWAGIALILAVIGLRVYYVACLRGPKIIRKWVQPDNVHYDENDPYALALIQKGYKFKWPFLRPRYYFVLGPSDRLLESGKWRYGPSGDEVTPVSRVDRWTVTWGKNGPCLSSSNRKVAKWGRYFVIEGLRERSKEE